MQTKRINTMSRTSLVTTMLFLLVGSCPLSAQDDSYFHDDFEDGNIYDGKPAAWGQGGWAGGGRLRAEAGDVYIEDCKVGGCSVGLRDTGGWARYRDASYRLQGRILEGNASIAFWGRSTDARVYLGYVNTRGEQGIGDTLSGLQIRTKLPFEIDMSVDDVVMKLDMIGDEISMSTWRAGDDPVDMPLASFRDSTLTIGTVGPTLDVASGSATAVFRWMEMAEIVPGDIDTNDVIDVRDVDYLSSAIREGLDNNRYDVNRDGQVNADDRRVLIDDVLNVWPGDANLDGEFSAGDLVQVLAMGKYETLEHAGWAEGDWNGDGVFGAGDLVKALEGGGYEQGPRPDTPAVPEPASALLLIAGLFGIAVRDRRRAATSVSLR